jgi:hypothetical protein
MKTDWTIAPDGQSQRQSKVDGSKEDLKVRKE